MISLKKNDIFFKTEDMQLLLEGLCLCHTVKMDDSASQYDASSPDELSFIKFCNK